MKKTIISLLGIPMLFLSFVANAAFEVQEVSVFPASVYVPIGFDTNDDVQIVVEGSFANSCFKSTKPMYSVDHINKEITIQNRAIVLTGVPCLYVVVPYSRVIDLGVLEGAGDYKILFEEDEGIMDPRVSVISPVSGKKHRKQMAILNVAHAVKDSQDDYLYAPFSSAMFSSKDRILRLRGMLQKSCMKVKTVKVVQPRPSYNVINILPIVELTKQDCTDEAEETFFDVPMENSMERGRYLLHIRTLSGNSLNEIVDIKN